jgi:hypothetical protein
MEVKEVIRQGPLINAISWVCKEKLLTETIAKGELAMKKALAVIGLILFLSAVAHGAVKTYQVTGPVLEATDTMIAVQKAKERWEIARDKDTKVTGDLKVGEKVTIEYRMTATKVEVKAAKPKTEKKKK